MVKSVFDEMSSSISDRERKDLLKKINRSMNLKTGTDESIYHVDKIQILSLSGQLIMKVVNANSLNISELANGVYVLQVISHGDCFIEKIIKY